MDRKKMIKIGLGSVAGLVALAGVGFALLLSSFDAESCKTQVVAAANKATGRKLDIPGKMEISLYPVFGIRTGKAVLYDPKELGGAPFATVTNASFAVGLLPLITRKLDVDEVRLEGLSLKLLTTENGRNNWEYGFSVFGASDTKANASAANGKKDSLEITVETLSIPDMTFSYRDASTGGLWAGSLDAFSLTNLGANKGFPLNLTGSVRDERSARRGDFTVKGECSAFSAGKVALRLDTAKFDATGFSGSEFTLTAKAGVEASGERLAAVAIKGLEGTFTMPAKQAKEAEEDEERVEAAKEVRTVFSKGQLAYVPAVENSPASLEGEVTLNTLDLDEIFSRITPGYVAMTGETVKGAPNLSKPTVGTSARGSQIAHALGQSGSIADAPATSSQEEDTEESGAEADEAIQAAAGAKKAENAYTNAAISITADTVILRGMPFTHVNASYKAKDGKAEAPCTADLFGGSVSALTKINLTKNLPDVNVNCSVKSVNMEAATTKMTDKFVVTGVLDGSLTATGKGTGFTEVAHSLQGRSSVRVSKGTIRGFGLIPSDMPAAKDIPAEFDFDRMSASAEIKEGVASTRDLLLQARPVSGKGGGKIHFAYGQMDLGIDFTPAGKTAIPVAISGPYRSLSYSVDTGPRLKTLPKGTDTSKENAYGRSPVSRTGVSAVRSGVSARPVAAPAAAKPKAARKRDALQDAAGMLF